MRPKKLRKLEQFRLPDDVSRWLKEHSKLTGKTKTRLVEEALRMKIGLKEAA
jgi:predicted DNA-binding protein